MIITGWAGLKTRTGLGGPNKPEKSVRPNDPKKSGKPDDPSGPSRLEDSDGLGWTGPTTQTGRS